VVAPGKYPANDPGDATGHHTPLAPKFTFNLGANYILPLGGTSDLRFTANYVHKSRIYFEPDNALSQAGYGVANASIEYNLNAHLGLEVFVKNIGNKLYNVQENTAVGAYAVTVPTVVRT
jgi:iron complex outermembrane receptor protein